MPVDEVLRRELIDELIELVSIDSGLKTAGMRLDREPRGTRARGSLRREPAADHVIECLLERGATAMGELLQLGRHISVECHGGAHRYIMMLRSFAVKMRRPFEGRRQTLGVDFPGAESG